MTDSAPEPAPLTTNDSAAIASSEVESLRSAVAVVGSTGRYARLVAGVGVLFVPLFVFFGGSILYPILTEEIAMEARKVLYVDASLQFVGALLAAFSAFQLNRFAVTAQALRSNADTGDLLVALKQLRILFGAGGVLSAVALVLYIAGRIFLLVNTGEPGPPAPM